MNFDIFFPTPLASIDDPANDNVDVCVTTEDGETYTLLFITPDNLKFLMDSNHEDFISPTFKYIIVKRIDESIILQAVKEMVSNLSLLSYYGKD